MKLRKKRLTEWGVKAGREWAGVLAGLAVAGYGVWAPLEMRGQEEGGELAALEAVAFPVVEESRLLTTGELVHVVGAEVIQQLNAQDLSAALRRVPGVTVSRYNPVGAFGGGDGGAIFIRGHGAGRPGGEISMMVDGIPRFVGVWTHPLLDTLSVDLAGAMEVYKSPQPVRFGNMAFGGVNLRPKAAEREGWHGMAQGSYGTFETWMANAEAGWAQDGWAGYLQASHRESEGHRTDADGRVDAGFFHGSKKWADRWEASLVASWTDARVDDPQPVGGPAIPITERYETTNVMWVGKLVYAGDGWTATVKPYWEDGKIDWRQWNVPPPPPFPAQQLNTVTGYDNYGVRTVIENAADADWHWQAGLDVDQYGGEVEEVFALAADSTFAEETFGLVAPYALLSRRWETGDGQTWVLSGGARAMAHDVFEDEVTGQAGLTWQQGSWQLYGNWAHAVNFPGVYVSVFGRRPPPWTVGEGWQDLAAETVNHVEAGGLWTGPGGTSFAVSVFQDEVSDAVRIAPPPPAGRITNLGDYTLRGAEAMAQFALGPVKAFAGLAWMEADDDVPNAPDWTFSTGLNYARGPWVFSADYQYVGEQLVLNPRFSEAPQAIDSFGLVSARAGWRFDLGEYPAEIFAHGENLLDEDYAYRPGYPMPGAMWTGGLLLRF